MVRQEERVRKREKGSARSACRLFLSVGLVFAVGCGTGSACSLSPCFIGYVAREEIYETSSAASRRDQAEEAALRREERGERSRLSGERLEGLAGDARLFASSE